ncbi:MAG TPA: hypothetical protein VNM22_09760 [Candidatus Limnocylindrales bacterium]|nr:hypothetical protein [Candidatus Limnocylindrales bacterium]
MKIVTEIVGWGSEYLSTESGFKNPVTPVTTPKRNPTTPKRIGLD